MAASYPPAQQLIANFDSPGRAGSNPASPTVSSQVKQLIIWTSSRLRRYAWPFARDHRPTY
jgi:hypothetical protein